MTTQYPHQQLSQSQYASQGQQRLQTNEQSQSMQTAASYEAFFAVPQSYPAQQPLDPSIAFPSTGSQQMNSSLLFPTSSQASHPSSSRHYAASPASIRPPSAVARFPTPAPAGPSTPTFFPGASATSALAPPVTQSDPGVSTRIINSLQSLVALLEKQNAKLEKHDERLKTLGDDFTQLKNDTSKCLQTIEGVSKNVTKKLKAPSDVNSKALTADIAKSLEKDLVALRKEAIELGKIAKMATTNEECISRLADTSRVQTQLLQAFTAHREEAADQADSIVERISDHQLDLLHRLQDQFRLVTAAVSTSALTTQQVVQQSASRHEQLRETQAQRLFDTLKSLSSSPSLSQRANAPQEGFVMPTPPVSQLPRLASRAPSMPSIPEVFNVVPMSHRCQAVDCTACLMQATQCSSDVQDRGDSSLSADHPVARESSAIQPQPCGLQVLQSDSQTTETQISTVSSFPIPKERREVLGTTQGTTPLVPTSPNRHAGASARSRSNSNSRNLANSLRASFVMKKRKIIQSDEEEEDANEEVASAPGEMCDRDAQLHQQPPNRPRLDRFNIAFEKVEAWRQGATSATHNASAGTHASITDAKSAYEPNQDPVGAASAAAETATPAISPPERSKQKDERSSKKASRSKAPQATADKTRKRK